MCGKTISWLRYATKLLQKVNQDPDIKEALLDGRINANAASSLMEITDEEERQRIFQIAIKKASCDYEEKLKKQDNAIFNTNRKLKKAEKVKEEAEECGDIDDITNADALIEKHTSTLEERKRERNDITPRVNSKNVEEAIDDIDAEPIIENDSDEEEPTAPKKSKVKITMKSARDNWVKDIEASIARGHMTDEHETITPILNNCFADMIKAMFEEKISYQDFVYRWSTRFAEAGLPVNAGGDVDINDEIG
jgi:hypothetical protein